MKTMLKRSMAILLILLMVISVLPMSAMAATVSSEYLPIYFGMSSSTSTSLSLYRLNSGSSSSYTTNNTSSSSSTPYPWAPTDTFIKTYSGQEYIPVDALRTSLRYSTTNTNGIFMDKVYYRTNNSSSISLSEHTYTWEIHSPYTQGVKIPTTDSIAITIYILNNGEYVTEKTVYIENPFVSEDYTIKYTVSKTTNDLSPKTTTESNKTFDSSKANDKGDLEVILSAVAGNYDASSFEFTNVAFNSTERYLTLGYSPFEKVGNPNDMQKKILSDNKADFLYKATVTVTAKSGNYLRIYDNETTKNTATITFYQPVALGYTDLLTIGDQVILKAVDPTDPSTYKWIGLEYGTQPSTAHSTGTSLSATYDLTSVTTASPQYAIKVANNTSKATTAYTIRVAESAQGTCNVTSFNLGTYEMDYRPELKGDTKHDIIFDILPNNKETNKITLKFTIQFAGGATEAQYVDENLNYKTVAGSSVTFDLSSLIKNFANFSDEQKAQFTFKITDFTDDDNQDFGNYFISYQGNSSTAGVTTLTNDGNGDGKPGISSYVDNSCFLDDYRIVYKANRNTIASDDHGFTVQLTNTTSDGSFTDSFKVKFTASEGEKPTISTSSATLSAAAGSNSSSVYLKNYIGNFSADLGLTYKITSRTYANGTFYVGGAAATANATGSITASAPAIYYAAKSGAASGSTDTLTITVYQGSTTIGTITYTGKVGTSSDCYTERQFDAAYPDEDTFAVVVTNTANRSYTFKASDFANSDIDLSDKDYDDYYIEVTTDPIGGELDGLDRYYTIDVADLSDLVYTRSAKTDTGIDAFTFKLYTASDRSAGTYTMWIVPNSDYLSDVDGYTEEEFKKSYGTKSGFGVYASSSGISFDADDFTNGSYKLENDYSDAYIEIVDEPIIGTLKEGSSTVGEEDRIAVADLGDLKYTWEDFDTSDIDNFSFYIYSSKSGSTKAVSTKFTMWIVGNKSLVSSTASENWSATGTTMPIYKVTDVEVSDNIGSVTLDADWVEEALDTVKTGSDVTIAVTTKGEAKGLSLTVDKSLFSLSNASKIKYITLSEGTTGASISVSVSDILSAGGTGKDFTVTLNKLTISTANDIVANALVASTATAARSVAFKAGNANITFDNVGAATLSIPYTNSSSYDDEMVVIYDYSGGSTPLVSSEFTGRYALADISKGGQYLVAVNSISFSDVSSNWAWTRGYIPSLAARGTISGMGGQNAGKYMPDASLTRAEFIKLLVVSLGLEDNSATNPFSDMSDHWAKQVVAAAVKHNIVSSGTTFSPDTAITRKDMALFAYNAAKAAGLTLSSSGSTTTFKDENEITGNYLTAVKAMQAAGIINGMGGQYEGYYLPNNGTDRASAAKIIWFLNAMLYGWSTSGKY